MSIRLMTDAWKSNMPAGRKMVLLALCDNANDQGECYPSISMLAEKCSMSERSVFSHIAELEKVGAVVRQNRAGRSTVYQLDPCKFCTPANSAPLQPLHPTPATVAPQPLQILHPTPANSAPITVIEPSIEPSRNHKTGVPCPSDVDPQVWADWQVVRKAKKAGALTATALDGVRREAERAGWPIGDALRECCARGWVGFKADWVARKPSGQAAPISFAQQDEQARRRRWEEMTGRKWPDDGQMPEFVDVQTVERISA